MYSVIIGLHALHMSVGHFGSSALLISPTSQPLLPPHVQGELGCGVSLGLLVRSLLHCTAFTENMVAGGDHAYQLL